MAELLLNIEGIDFKKFNWFKPISKKVLLEAGQRTKNIIEVPTKDAQKILTTVVRFVLDLPRNSSPQVVWTQGDSELLVHSDTTQISCDSGVITLSTEFECDQYERIRIPVPIGVGTNKLPSGLVMSAYSDLQGPAEIVEIWSTAITAFAWESLVELARVIAANVGNDSTGRALVPGSIGASKGKLLVQPIARHTLRVEG